MNVYICIYTFIKYYFTDNLWLNLIISFETIQVTININRFYTYLSFLRVIFLDNPFDLRSSS